MIISIRRTFMHLWKISMYKNVKSTRNMQKYTERLQ